MQEDRVRGQIISTRVKRQAAFEFAKAMLPLIRQARGEIISDGKTVVLRALADWLNQRNYKTIKGKVWRTQSIKNLLHTDATQRAAAEDLYRQEVAFLKWRGHMLDDADLVIEERRRGDAVKLLQVARDQTIADGNALGEALRHSIG